MIDDSIDTGQLRREVRAKYRDVALRPGRAPGEKQARAFDVYGYAFLAFKEG